MSQKMLRFCAVVAILALGGVRDVGATEEMARMMSAEAHSICPFAKTLRSMAEMPNKKDLERKPACFNSRLSQTYDAEFPQVTYNSKGEEFPNALCTKHLGREYGFDSEEELDVIVKTGDTISARMAEVGSYDATPVCLGAGMINCCEYKKSEQCGTDFEYDVSKCVKNAGTDDLSYVHNHPSLVETATADEKPELEPHDMNQRIRKQMHGESYGCFNVEVEVRKNLEKDLPKKYHVGLLEEPGRVFKAEMRLSGNKNLTTRDADDIRVRGMSLKIDASASDCEKIKLPGLGKSSQPENMRNIFDKDLPAFQESGIVDMLFISVRSPEKPGGIPFNTFVDGNLEDNFDGFVNGDAPGVPIDRVSDFFFNPLLNTYGSGAAYALGKGAAAKWHAELCPGQARRIPRKSKKGEFSDPDFSYNLLKDTLRRRRFRRKPLEMCIYIQLQENACTEPIEDASVRWMTEPIHVMTIKISEVDDLEHDTLACDTTMLNPFRTFVAHFPLGAIQRVRGHVYAHANIVRTAGNQYMRSIHEWGSMMGMQSAQMKSLADLTAQQCYFEDGCNYSDDH